ncbi:MAG: preprotein translocase subunit SecE [Chloroflexi bacterium]|nr:preprotein translocase subunit SecE [Chloroflexota bacterium]
MHRVQWPTQQTIIKHTTVVISVLIFMAIYVGAWDFLWTRAFSYLLHVREL